MKQFCLNQKSGILHETDKQEKLVPGEDAAVLLMNLQEFKNMKEQYFHKSNLIHSLESLQYCKIENFSDCTQGTMMIPKVSIKKMELFTFGYYLRENILIIIEEKESIEKILQDMTNDSFGECSLYQLLLFIFEYFLKDDVIYLQHIEKQLESLEEHLLKEIPENIYEILMEYRKKMSILHSYYEQLMNVGDTVQDKVIKPLSAQEQIAWQRFSNRVERLHNHVEMLREYLIQIRELYQAMIGEKQNKVMTFLTIVTTIFMPLTLIAGWYGMNFPNMPEFAYPYAYLIVITISILIIILEIIYFKHKKMI